MRDVQLILDIIKIAICYLEMLTTEFGRKLLQSLPPMEASDLDLCQASLEKLGGFSSDFLQDIDSRTCQLTVSGAEKSELVVAVEEQLEEYQEKTYGSKENIVHKYQVTETDEKQFDIHTYAAIGDSANHSMAYWAGSWKVQRTSETEADVSGEISLHVYFYEGGNFQMRSQRNFPVQEVSTVEEKVHAMVAKMEATKMSYDAKMSKRIVGKITADEKTLYQDIKTIYQDKELDESFKKIRRILPITKTRFKWDVAAQKQVNLLRQKEKEAEVNEHNGE